MSAMALGQAQLLPALGCIDRALELLRVDEGLDDQDRMPVAGLPVGAQAIEGEAQDAGAEVGLVGSGRMRKRALLAMRLRRLSRWA